MNTKQISFAKANERHEMTEQCDVFIFVTRASPKFIDGYLLKNQEQI